MDPLIERALQGFVATARAAFADELRAVVLFGSAAEDRLRATSDVNLIVVLGDFAPARAADFAARLPPDASAARLRAMWLRESEIAEAARAFAVKFRDIARRHRVLHGADPFAALAIPRADAVAQLRQGLLGQVLALRHRLARPGRSEAALAAAAADISGPLRANAAELLELEGAPPAASPRAALQTVAGQPLTELSRLRDDGRLAAGEAEPLLNALLGVAEAMLARARALA